MKNISNYKNIAVAAMKKSGQELIKRYNNFDRTKIKFKDHSEILTQADLASERIILTEIRRNFPAHHILSEESGDVGVKSDYLWIVDPIDGTTNFTMHNPIWGISLALAYKNEMVLGIIYAPIINELYVAVKGGGATLNNKKIQVSKNVKGKTLNAFCSARELRHVRRANKYYMQYTYSDRGCYKLGSASVELAYVAAGRLESMVIPGAYPWDVAAGILMVREAGGRVTDFDNKKWSLGSQDMLASNGRVHKNVLEKLK